MLEQVIEPKKNLGLADFLQIFWLECSDNKAKEDPANYFTDDTCTYDPIKHKECWINDFYSVMDTGDDSPLELVTDINLKEAGTEQVPEKPPEKVIP